VLPAIDEATPRLQWTDATAFVALGGLAVAFVAWRLQGRSTVPAGDPFLEESAKYTHP
jgi:hypothetical protein